VEEAGEYDVEVEEANEVKEAEETDDEVVMEEMKEDREHD
jgi:hypothetical protein